MIRTVFQGLERCNRDDSGGPGMRTVAGRFYRCGSVWNGAGESPAVPKGLGRCFRAWNGAGGPVAVFYAYNTDTESVMLPETLRHRYKRDNRKKMRDCLTLFRENFSLFGVKNMNRPCLLAFGAYTMILSVV